MEPPLPTPIVSDFYLGIRVTIEQFRNLFNKFKTNHREEALSMSLHCKNSTKSMILALLLLCTVFLGGSCRVDPPAHETGNMEQLQSSLETMGFDVSGGSPMVPDIPRLFCQGIIPCGYGNNALTPYVCLSPDIVPGTGRHLLSPGLTA